MVSLCRVSLMVLTLSPSLGMTGLGIAAIAAETADADEIAAPVDEVAADGEAAPYRAVVMPAPIYDVPVLEPSKLGGEFDTPEQRRYEQRAREYEAQRRRRVERERGGFKGFRDWLD